MSKETRYRIWLGVSAGLVLIWAVAFWALAFVLAGR